MEKWVKSSNMKEKLNSPFKYLFLWKGVGSENKQQEAKNDKMKPHTWYVSREVNSRPCKHILFSPVFGFVVGRGDEDVGKRASNNINMTYTRVGNNLSAVIDCHQILIKSVFSLCFSSLFLRLGRDGLSDWFLEELWPISTYTGAGRRVRLC